MADKSSDVSGAERAAILLLTLGEQDAAELLKHMDAREVQRVGQAMAGLKNVPREKIHGTEDCRIVRVPFRDRSGEIIPDWISRFQIWPYLESFADEGITVMHLPNFKDEDLN